MSGLQRESKENRAFNGQNARSLADQLESTKSQLKQSLADLQTLRAEWMPPSEAKLLQDRLSQA